MLILYKDVTFDDEPHIKTTNESAPPNPGFPIVPQSETQFDDDYHDEPRLLVRDGDGDIHRRHYDVGENPRIYCGDTEWEMMYDSSSDSKNVICCGGDVNSKCEQLICASCHIGFHDYDFYNLNIEAPENIKLLYVCDRRMFDKYIDIKKMTNLKYLFIKGKLYQDVRIEHPTLSHICTDYTIDGTYDCPNLEYVCMSFDEDNKKHFDPDLNIKSDKNVHIYKDYYKKIPSIYP